MKNKVNKSLNEKMIYENNFREFGNKNEKRESAYPNRDRKSAYPNEKQESAYLNRDRKSAYPNEKQESAYLNRDRKSAYPNEKQESAYLNRDRKSAYPNEKQESAYLNRDRKSAYPNEKQESAYLNRDRKSAYPNEKQESAYLNRDRKSAYPNEKQESAYLNRDRKSAYPNEKQESAYLNRDRKSAYPNEKQESAYLNRDRKSAYPNEKQESAYLNRDRKSAYPNEKQESAYLNRKQESDYLNEKREKVYLDGHTKKRQQNRNHRYNPRKAEAPRPYRSKKKRASEEHRNHRYDSGRNGMGSHYNSIEEYEASRRVLRKRKVKIVCGILAFIIVLTLIALGYARFVEPRRLVTKEQEYHSENLDFEENDDHLRIAVFADTHFSDFYTVNDFRKAAAAINNAKPDVIFFLGDLVDNLSEYEGDTSEISDILDELKATYGKYAVYGNHDYGGDMQFEYEGIMENGGFVTLINESVSIDGSNIVIHGIDDILIGYGDVTTAENLDNDDYNIVLCHEPDVADDIIDYNVNLMLSGHTHGRQINLKIFDRLILPTYGKKYVRGAFSLVYDKKLDQVIVDRSSGEKGETGFDAGSLDMSGLENEEDGGPLELYVTGGLGMSKINMRFMSPPEVNIIDITT